MDTEELRRRLQVLSEQEGHPGTISIPSVIEMIELRDEKIRQLTWELEEERLGEDS